MVCSHVVCRSLLSCVQLVAGIIKSHSELSELMIGIVYHHQELIKSAEPGNFTYELEGHATKTGMEVVDGLLALWQEHEIISVDMPLAVGDLSGLRYLRKVTSSVDVFSGCVRVCVDCSVCPDVLYLGAVFGLQRTQEILFEAKNAGGEKLKYSCRGVGGDHSCGLQVTVDGGACAAGLHGDGPTSTPSDEHVGAVEFMKHIMEFPTNTLRISLAQFRNISQIFEVVKAGKHGFVQPGGNTHALGTPTPYVPIVSACALHQIPSDVVLDDFVVDLAVGIGATQLHVDGLYSSETSSKIQRLQTIAEETSALGKAGKKKTTAAPTTALRLAFVGGKFHTMHS